MLTKYYLLIDDMLMLENRKNHMRKHASKYAQPTTPATAYRALKAGTNSLDWVTGWNLLVNAFSYKL